MAYRFRKGESIPQEIKRIVQEEIDSAVDQLKNGAQSRRDERIHEARKSIKKIRGVLKLIRFELGKTYRRENSELRDLGRQLSELRDAGAIIGTFDSVVERFSGRLNKANSRAIRRGLLLDKREKEASEDVNQVMSRAAKGLLVVRRRITDWPLRADSFSVLAPGLKASYKGGRKAMRLAQANGRAADFHEWRKRAKDHWYHLRLLENLWTDVMEAREASVHELESALGEDHNLVVLQDKLAYDPARYGAEQTVAVFRTLAVEQQKSLLETARSLGARIYEAKPGQFLLEFTKFWDAWRTEAAAERRPVRSTARKGPQRANRKKNAA